MTDKPAQNQHTHEHQRRSYAAGQVLSRIFHPILLNITMFIIVGYAGLSSIRSGMLWAGVCILVQVLPPTLFYTSQARQGAYSDEDVSIRQQRNGLYMVSLATTIVGTAIMIPFGLPRPFLALLVGAALMAIIAGGINLFWKISVHGATIAATAMVALQYSLALGLFFWLCALAVGWARVRTHNHTPLQVLAGFGVAVVVVQTMFTVLV